MADLIVTFGRGIGNPPVLYGAHRRSESIAIGGSATLSDLVCDPGSFNMENIADLYAGANCWVQIGSSPTAEPTGTDPYTQGFYMASGERMQFAIVKGDRVSVISG